MPDNQTQRELSERALHMKQSAQARTDNFLPARRVWERYGVTSMTLYRWLHDGKMNFPAPMYLGRFRYWRLTDLELWERNIAAKSRVA